MNIGIDLDGTIYRSNTLIPGSKYAIDKLIQNNNLFFLTNNGSTPPTAILKKLNSLLDQVPEDKGSLLIKGKEGIFSAGFDLKVMQGGDPESMAKLEDELEKIQEQITKGVMGES